MDEIDVVVHMYNPFVQDNDIQAFLRRHCLSVLAAKKIQGHLVKLREGSSIHQVLLPSAQTEASCTTLSNPLITGGAEQEATSRRPAQDKDASVACGVSFGSRLQGTKNLQPVQE